MWDLSASSDHSPRLFELRAAEVMITVLARYGAGETERTVVQRTALFSVAHVAFFVFLSLFRCIGSQCNPIFT